MQARLIYLLCLSLALSYFLFDGEAFNAAKILPEYQILENRVLEDPRPLCSFDKSKACRNLNTYTALDKQNTHWQN